MSCQKCAGKLGLYGTTLVMARSVGEGVINATYTSPPVDDGATSGSTKKASLLPLL